jgi:flagellar hook assembly protein FlgD
MLSAATQQLRFELAQRGRARIDVYDAAGRRVRRVVDGTFEAGLGAVAWDGRGEDGSSLPSGVYWVRLEAGNVVKGGKIVIAR